MKNQIVTALAFGVAVSASANAYAASTDVNVEVGVSQTALTIETRTTMSFGNFEITAANASGTLVLTGSNTISIDASSIVHNGGHRDGIILATGTPTAPVQFSCTSSALLVHETDPTQTMNISDTRIGYSAGVAICGVETLSGTLANDGTRSVGVASTLTFNSPISGTYSTANPGGVPITVDVVYQ